MFCPNCGQQNPDNANVCGNCGTRLSRPVAPTQNIQQPIQKPVQRPASQPSQPPVSMPVSQPVQNVNRQQMPQGQFMTNNLPQTVTKKSNKSIIIAVICVVLAIAIGVSAFFIIKNKKDKEAAANTPEAVAEKCVRFTYEWDDPDTFFKYIHAKFMEEMAKENGLSVSKYKEYGFRL